MNVTLFVLFAAALLEAGGDALVREGLQIMYPYGSKPDQPLRFETKGNYADPDADYQGVEYGWNHTLGDIVNALIQAASG